MRPFVLGTTGGVAIERNFLETTKKVSVTPPKKMNIYGIQTKIRNEGKKAISKCNMVKI